MLPYVAAGTYAYDKLTGSGGGGGGPGPRSDREKALDVQASKQSTANVQQQTGVGLGSTVTTSSHQDRSKMRSDQSVAERAQQQEVNFLYGGTKTGAADAVAAARNVAGTAAGNINNYGQASANIGNLSLTQAQGAGARQANGTGSFLTSDARGATGQYGSADQLRQLAMRGPGPSVAQANLQANTGQAMRQQLAMAGSGRGAGGGAAAFRQAASNQALIQGQANAQAAALGAQEAQDWRTAQANYLGTAGSLYGQGRQNDMAGVAAMQNQQQINDAYALGNYGMALQAQGQAGNLAAQSGQLALGGEQLANQINMGALQGSTGYEQNLTQQYGISQGIGMQQQQIDQQREAAWIGAGATVGAGALQAASDIRAKKDIKEMDLESLRAELDAIKTPNYGRAAYPMPTPVEAGALDMVRNAPAYEYKYKDPNMPGAAPGKQIGPMAQDLAKTAAGRDTVVESTDGMLGVDLPRLSLKNTAALSGQQKEIDALKAELAKLEEIAKPKSDGFSVRRDIPQDELDASYRKLGY